MKIHPDLNFSYSYIKGSPAKRTNIIKNLNQKLLDTIMPNIENKHFNLNSLRELHQNILPEPKNVEIKRNFSFLIDGYTNFQLDKQNNFIGQTIKIPIWRKTKPINYIITLIHENTHVLDTLVNPKKVALSQKLSNAKAYTNDIRNKIYENTLYSAEKATIDKPLTKRLQEIEEYITILLKKKQNKEKIDILNDMRYNLESEKLAFEEQYKYAKLLINKGYKIKDHDTLNYNKIYWFDEKINLLKKMILGLIKEERAKIASKTN